MYVKKTLRHDHDGVIDVAHEVHILLPPMYLQLLLRIPTDSPNVHIQFSDLYHFNPRYAYAPPTLAYGPARGWL